MKKFFPTLLLLLSCGLSAVAQPSGNPLVFGENRLTLITPTLFRLEFARDGKFIDDPTIFAYDRSNLLPADRFEVRALGGDRYEITTEALRIVYEHDGFPFGLHNFAAYYKLNGKEKKFTNRCIFRNNLGGPVETLDRVTGEIPMQDGLLSRDGWYVIDDERSDLLVDGWLRPRDTRSHVQDQYCFVYGNDYKAALADLGAIGGRVPMRLISPFNTLKNCGNSSSEVLRMKFPIPLPGPFSLPITRGSFSILNIRPSLTRFCFISSFFRSSASMYILRNL